MKNFFVMIWLIIFALLAINPVLLRAFESFDETTRLIAFSLLMFLDFLIIMWLILHYYQTPLKKLELTLKHFIVWDLKDKEIKLAESANPSLNYILSFFERTLDTLKNIKDEFLQGKEIKWEVGLAKEIQEKMLVKKMIEIPSLEVVVKSKPAWEIGWDSHDIIKQEDNYYIYVWDATGHWVGAGFIMVMINALVSSLSKIYKSGAEILTKTNEELKPRVKANLLMTMLLLRWNETEKRLFITWAGHEYIMIYKHSTNKVYRVKSGWVALGMVKDIAKIIKEQEIKFERWDIAILYSDWITEAINTKKRDWTEELFGEQRLEEAIFNAPKLPGTNYKTARSVFNNITIKLSNFMGYKFRQLDDITLIVIQYKPEDYDITKDFSTDIPKDFITEWYWE